MSAWHYFVRTVIVCVPIALSACGGGGDNGEAAAKPSSLPADGFISVDGGNSSVTVGAYQLDTTYKGASSSVVYDVDTLEAVSPESPAFDAGFIFSPNDKRKFAVAFFDNTAATPMTFACRAGSWTALELQELASRVNVASIPVCPSGMTIDTSATTHRIQMVAMRLPSLSDPSKSVTISANFGWTLQSTTPQPVGSSSITVEPGSTSVTPGSYRINGGQSGPDTLAQMNVDTTTVDSSAVSLNYLSLQNDPSRYVVLAQAATAPTVSFYACASDAWTADEMSQLGNEEDGLGRGLVRCPSQVMVQNNRLILDNAALNRVAAPGSSGNVIVLSANIPVSTSSAVAISITAPPSPAPAVATPQ